MSVPNTSTTPVPLASCRHCTVPTAGTALCTFCATYTPPESVTQRLDIVVNKVDLLRHDINTELQNLTADTPLFVSVDLVTALGHLRLAVVALDRATDTLEVADAAEVLR